MRKKKFKMRTRKELLNKLEELNKSYEKWYDSYYIGNYILAEINLLNWVLGFPERKK